MALRAAAVSAGWQKEREGKKKGTRRREFARDKERNIERERERETAWKRERRRIR